MAGYVIECLLKAVLLTRLRLPALPEGYWHHDLGRLIEQAGLQGDLDGPRAVAIGQHFALLRRHWDVRIRYSGRSFDRELSMVVLKSVEVIRSWLLERL